MENLKEILAESFSPFDIKLREDEPLADILDRKLIRGLIQNYIAWEKQDDVWNYWINANYCDREKLKDSLMFIHKKLTK